MPTTRIPEGVTVELVEDGHWVEHSGHRHYSSKKRIRVDRVWVVKYHGEIVGAIEYVMITREQRTPGRMYVNSRWQSPGFRSYNTTEMPRLYGGPSYKREAFSKSDAIDSIMWDVKRKEKEGK